MIQTSSNCEETVEFFSFRFATGLGPFPLRPSCRSLELRLCGHRRLAHLQNSPAPSLVDQTLSRRLAIAIVESVDFCWFVTKHHCTHLPWPGNGHRQCAVGTIWVAWMQPRLLFFASFHCIFAGSLSNFLWKSCPQDSRPLVQWAGIRWQHWWRLVFHRTGIVSYHFQGRWTQRLVRRQIIST